MRQLEYSIDKLIIKPDFQGLKKEQQKIAVPFVKSN